MEKTVEHTSDKIDVKIVLSDAHVDHVVVDGERFDCVFPDMDYQEGCINELERRNAELEGSINEVAEKWAVAQCNYEDAARRVVLLESRNAELEGRIAELEDEGAAAFYDNAYTQDALRELVRDMWEFGESSNYPYTPLESVRWAQMREEYRERMAALGIEVER